jgi:hypothetical protein
MSRLLFAACVAGMFAASAPLAFAADILIHDHKSEPESLAYAPDGTLIVGSASSPYVYRVRSGSTTAETFIDASSAGPGTFFFGQLIDPATNTVWSCELTPVPATKPAAYHTALISSDLRTGKQKLRWNLPGDNTICNDFSIGPDKALYISDTANGRIYRLAPGGTAAELYMENRLLNGIDGITFLNGVLYVNNVFYNKLYRIPVDASGKPQTPVDIWMDAPVKGPDGMRAVNGKLLLAENGAGKVDALTISGDTAHVAVLKDGLKVPTAVEPAGNTIWIGERGAGKADSIPMPK